MEQALYQMKNWLPQRADSVIAHFRMAENDRYIAPLVDSALAWPGLSGKARRSLLSQVAAMCYVLNDPDFNPRGIGMHLGNPNMPINRYMGFPQYANLIPSHPLHQQWMAEARGYISWKLGDNISPGGAWREEMSYQQAGLPHIWMPASTCATAGNSTRACCRISWNKTSITWPASARPT